MEDSKRQFDGTKTKLSTRFMAGRGQVLLQAINKPLQAQEFAKRRKLQEMLFKGQINLEQANIPEELRPSNFIMRDAKTLDANEERAPNLHGQHKYHINSPGTLQTLGPSYSSSDNFNQFTTKRMHPMNNSSTNFNDLGKDFLLKDIEKRSIAKPLRKPEKSKKKQVQDEKGQDSINIEESLSLTQNHNPSKTEQFQSNVTHEQSWSLMQSDPPIKTDAVQSIANDMQGWSLPQNNMQNLSRKTSQLQSKVNSYDQGWSLPQSDQQNLSRQTDQLQSKVNSYDQDWSLPQNNMQKLPTKTSLLQSKINSSDQGWSLPQSDQQNLPRKTDQLQSKVNSHDQGWSLPQNELPKTKSPWMEWEDNVIIDGSLDEDNLPQIAAVEDNDDINDVVVNEYIDALQTSQLKDTKEQRKITAQRVQKYSKLKSTSNADCLRLSPGTIPNPPKGDDRWGGTELNGCTLGWGDPGNNHRNAYDDGSSVWSSGGSQYGGMGWSKAS